MHWFIFISHMSSRNNHIDHDEKQMKMTQTFMKHFNSVHGMDTCALLNACTILNKSFFYLRPTAPQI